MYLKKKKGKKAWGDVTRSVEITSVINAGIRESVKEKWKKVYFWSVR